jgi:hypothetical protein
MSLIQLAEELARHERVWSDPTARELLPVLASPARRSTSGYPYLEEAAWVRLRDWVPHILASGQRVLDAVEVIQQLAGGVFEEAAMVVRQVVNTAAITAPPDLWLLRQVLGTLRELGLLERLARGEVIVLSHEPLAAAELEIDFQFLLGRGYLARSGKGYRCADHRIAARVMQQVGPVDFPADLSEAWAEHFAGAPAGQTLRSFAHDLPSIEPRETGHWSATPEEIEIGYRLVPVVLGLRRAERIEGLLAGEEIPELAEPVLHAAGAVRDGVLTSIGERLLRRAPGPFGIIEAYHPYMAALPTILRKGRGSVHVRRDANIAASQDANRRTFERANDALDAFCDRYGFTYRVFIEHAMGRGEATRQRYVRSGDSLIYFGADLEDAAIDAAIAEREAGRLPPNMRFVRDADIGRPEVLVRALREAGVDTEGAVMLVGNGFHEVRDQTDEHMVEVFAGYERAGIVLLFTEESALSIDDLLKTAWNTYHAGFKYVHERSGQGLRPAEGSLPSHYGTSLPASWTECATRAGYVRADEFCSRSRTVYPYTPPSGHNPAISVNHFFVPGRIARRLGMGGQ